MKKLNLLLLLTFLFYCSLQTISQGLNCGDVPTSGANLGTEDTYTTGAFNTSTNLTITNAGINPQVGVTYTIYVKYSDDNGSGNCIEYTLNNATIAINNNTITFTFANGQTLPPAVVGCNSFQNWMRFKQTGASNWQYFLDYINCSNKWVLPITLVNYQATRYLYGSNKAAGIITWETASESNSSRVEIQRATSAAPNDFNYIGTVYTKALNGNSTSTLYYKYVDCAPYNGTNYYRLKMIDLDEQYKFSTIASISASGYQTQCPVSCSGATISGPSTICESGSYSLAIPAPATNVTWSINSSVATITAISATNLGAFVTVNRNGATGSVTLSAQMDGGCGTATKTINFGVGSGYTISGPSSFCTSAVYSVPNLPSGATVSWSASPSWMAYFTNASGSQVTVNKGNPGTFNLTATISGCGGSSTSATKNYITAGVPSSGDLWTSWDQSVILQSRSEGVNYIFENTTVHFRVDGATSASQYSYNAGSLSNTPYFDWDYMHFDMEPGSWASFGVTVTVGGCTETLYYDFLAIEQPSYNYYSVAPNPVNSDLTIYVDDEKLKNQKIEKSSDQVIQQVIIMDKFGSVLAQQKYPGDTKKIRLNVSGLATDMYIVKIFNGKKWTSIKFMKK
jgi:hypothetical protein